MKKLPFYQQAVIQKCYFFMIISKHELNTPTEYKTNDSLTLQSTNFSIGIFRDPVNFPTMSASLLFGVSFPEKISGFPSELASPPFQQSLAHKLHWEEACKAHSMHSFWQTSVDSMKCIQLNDHKEPK
jgi:hypothetical protein